MIKVRNNGEVLVQLRKAGTQSAANDVDAFVVPFASRISAIYGKLGTAGVTSSQINDINLNGTTIFSASAKQTFATTDVVPSYSALTTDPTVLAKGDIISLDIDSVHSTPGVNLSIWVVLQRLKASGKAMVSDGIGPENE